MCALCGANLTHIHAIQVNPSSHSHFGNAVCLNCLHKVGLIGTLLGVNAGQNGA